VTSKSTEANKVSAAIKPAGDFSVKYLIEILFRRKRILSIPIVLVPLLSIIFSYTIPEIYMSTTTILLEKQDILNPLIRFQTAVALTNYDRLGTFRKIIYSRPLIEKAIHELKLDKEIANEPEKVRLVKMEWLVDHIRRNIHIISLTGDSFQIGATWDSPVVAKELVETVGRLFVEKSLQGSQREASAAVDFIQEQLEHYQEELNMAEKALREFKLKNIDRTLGQLSSLPRELEEYRSKLVKAKLHLEQERFNEQLLADRLTGEKPMVVAQALFVQNTPYQRHYEELKMKMGNLLATRDPSHPEVVKLQRELDFILDLLEREKNEKTAAETREIRSPVYQEITARLDDIRVKIKVLKREIEEYEKIIRQLEDSVKSIPGLEQTLARLEGEVKITREIYDMLKVKLEHARVSREVELEQQINRFTIIEPPLVPLARYKPIRRNYAMAGLAGGFIIGLMLIFVLEFVDSTIIRQGELPRKFGINVLGVIPKLYHPAHIGDFSKLLLFVSPFSWVRSFLGAKRFLLPEDFPQNLVLNEERMEDHKKYFFEGVRPVFELVEKVRGIGINARNLFDRQEKLIWSVISSRPKEGKTILAANLGILMAKDLRKPVLLIDGNLRNPYLSAVFSNSEPPGLSEVIRGEIPLREGIRSTGTPFLKLLPAGRSIDDPAELFESAQFKKTLEAVRQQFSFTLLELPDLATYTDASVVSPLTDGILVVAKLYSTRKKVLAAALERLEREKIIGFAVNNAEYWIPSWLYRWL
jgi:polysaccharide chain length determinant protein (PEP-CTERM system associated)